jgi:hypothetical protein
MYWVVCGSVDLKEGKQRKEGKEYAASALFQAVESRLSGIIFSHKILRAALKVQMEDNERDRCLAAVPLSSSFIQKILRARCCSRRTASPAALEGRKGERTGQPSIVT